MARETFNVIVRNKEQDYISTTVLKASLVPVTPTQITIKR